MPIFDCRGFAVMLELPTADGKRRDCPFHSAQGASCVSGFTMPSDFETHRAGLKPAHSQ
ncbi:MAG TPA: hypothetical protein PKY96_17625 [Flavobacteriales bacterium]|nr:hypothetical protein [Flavobacteriales bacterium]